MRSKVQHVIGIGELLWDVLPEGKKLGGAPCNFAYHAQKLGAKAMVVSAVGHDESGRELLQELDGKNISAELIQLNDKPTGTVDVKLNANGVPEYTIHENVAWDYIAYDDLLRQKIVEADIVCFGSLAQRNAVSRESITKILDCSRDEKLIVFDINLRQNFYTTEIIHESMQLSNVLKLNENELPAVCDMLGITAGTEESQVLELIKKYNLKLVAYTKGSNGSLLMIPSEKSFLPTPQVKVKDTVGAGDSFTAAMVIGFAYGHSLKEIHKNAVEIAAFVCTQDGAMPDYN